MRFVYMDIFLYICNMENEEDFSDWIEIDYRRSFDVLESVFGIDDPLSAYHKVESVKRLWEIGIHTTFYNRNKIIHNYGK